MSTMYLPEQMERESSSRTLPAFSMVSATWKPAATLESSMQADGFFDHKSLGQCDDR